MLETVLALLQQNDFMPHGQCFLWQKDILWLHVISDGIITLSYYSIPFVLIYFVYKRQDIQYRRIFILFGLFIFLCGTTHLLGLLTVWHPIYWFSGYIKAITAFVSLLTAISIWPLLPKALVIPSPTQLLASNKKLERLIADHKKIESQLNKLSLAIEYSSGMILITNAKGVIEYCNPFFYQFTGYTEAEVIGKKPNILKSDLTDPKIYKDLWTKIKSGKPWHGEFLDRKKNEDLYWCLQTISPIKDEHGIITNFVSIAHDISDRKHADETIKRLAFYDPLTTLPNRMLFKERLERALLQAKRSETLFSVMYMDLDRFKAINDTLGHLVGDKLLIEVGKRIKNCLREQETVSRLGGDEFAIIILDIQNPSSAGRVAQKIIDTFTPPFNIDGHEIFISTSIGISVYPNDAEEMEQLIKQADDALYLAKGAGRNGYEFFSESSNSQSIRRLLIETNLRKALNRGEFSLNYQPKIDLKTDSVIGTEALLRWFNPAIGQVSPTEFIPIAEDTGLIVPIGEWVIAQACQDTQSWQKNHQIKLPVAINLSARQFQHDGLLEKIDTIIASSGINPSLLEFEITESMLMHKPDLAIDVMQQFKLRGLKLSIDDFGTGYSSLSHLKRFPVDALKIDKSFVLDIATDQDDASIVKSVIALAHNMNLKVIAEGVEDKNQLDFLRNENCDQVQGFYFSPPENSEGLMNKFRSKQLTVIDS